jgi:uncharacterized damage-inducible protein DinB
MDILDRLLGHDAWTTLHLLSRCAELTDAQLRQPFDVGHGNLLDTWGHMIGNIETWTDLMSQTPVQPGAGDREVTLASLAARAESGQARFAALARRLAAEGRLDETWLDVLDDPPTRKTYGGAIAHVLTHNHAHRTEILHMLERLGVADLIEGDVLSWEKQDFAR